MLSARNQLKGTIKSVKLGGVMAEVILRVGNVEVVSVITRESAERMKLKAGDTAAAVVKATAVMVLKD
jgi:molybdopterin-binding protein